MNYLAVLAAAIAAFVVGWLWYGPFFGRQWRTLMGMPEGSMGMPGKIPPAKAMIGGFVTTLIMIWFLANFMNSLAVSSASQAAWLGLMVAVGFIGMALINSVWYEGRSWTLFFINAGHYVVSLIVAALVLFYF
ncbi:DUF1761 domain-containing protein [Candidatus Kaiserbacteria bacterium]|nr:DUF1761 domain-containing protein [Candidatus Kaiserbacteria bacterium]